MENVSIVSKQVKKISFNSVLEIEDQLAVEEPLEIQLEYGASDTRIRKSISVTMRTPGNDEELAAGFLFTEGIIKNSNEIKSIKHAGENRVVVAFAENKRISLEKTERNFYTTSSCGVCGKASIDAIKTVSVYKNQVNNILIKAALLYSLHDSLRIRQEIFDHTGGLHASALFDNNGNFITLREDVGRHNALDKLIGASLFNDQLPLNNSILLLSGRASFELIQKACMAGIKIVSAIGAPSSLAVELANECDMTLIGFLRNERFNIYSGEQRIRL